ncbi:MAG: permease [Candidatus Heimdallarchaeaceae archaeon]
MITFIPKEAVLKYLGKGSKKIIAYPAAAIAGFLIAVCSCTVLPLFAGIKKKGAGLGPAITFLFSAPAVNILALMYTGGLIGADIAIARAILALIFSMLIGYIMELLFPEKEKKALKDEQREKSEILNSNEDNNVNLDRELTEQKNTRTFDLKKFLNIVLATSGVVSGILLLTFDYELLTKLGFHQPYIFQTILWLVGILVLVTLSFVYQNSSVVLFLWLIYTLFTGTSQITYFTSDTLIFNLAITPTVSNMIAKALLALIVTGIVVIYANKKFEKEERREWMKETWNFVRSILPLIIIGVFIAGMLGVIIPEEWVEAVVGKNSVIGNLTGVLFGVFMYFPTLMEVPIARMFLDLGMARGVLLAYLLADPELSIQSILVTRKYLGDRKNLVYVVLVIFFTVIAGLLFGLIVSKEPITWI